MHSHQSRQPLSLLSLLLLAALTGCSSSPDATDSSAASAPPVVDDTADLQQTQLALTSEPLTCPDGENAELCVPGREPRSSCFVTLSHGRFLREVAQTFTVSRSGQPGRMRLLLRRIGDAPPDVALRYSFEIREVVNGVVPLDDARTFAQAAIDARALSSADQLVELSFVTADDSPPLLPGRTYALVVLPTVNSPVAIGLACESTASTNPFVRAAMRQQRVTGSGLGKTPFVFDKRSLVFSLSLDDGGPMRETQCRDGRDDDWDARIDCDDPDCQNPPAAVCLTGACGTDDDCDPGQTCVDNACRRPAGDACSNAVECLSGFCANGFCCDAACDGPCERCNHPGEAGTCRPLDDGTAPAGACGAYLCDGVSGSCPTSCQTHDDCRGDSFCDAGECVPQRGDGETCDENAQCSSGSCSDGVCCESACDGACETCSLPGEEGLCLARPAGTRGSPACGAFVCDGDSRDCPTTCASNADCASDAICDDGECITQKPNGGACSVNEQCQSGICVSGVCCNTACDQPEGECTLAAECSTGTCTVPPKSTQVACADDGNPCTVDRCDGAGGCEHVPGNPGVVCRAAAGVCDVEETCTGTSDQCPPDQKKAAGTVCSDDGNVCTSDVCDGTSADCTHPAVADETSCGQVTYGTWGACGGFSGTCGESGTRSRTVTAPRCVSGGCQNVTYSETEPCSRDTDGQTCGTTQIGGWGACVYDHATCSNSGYRTRTITTYVCTDGGCETVQTTETDHAGCARNTLGTTCGASTYTGWGACGGFSDVCDESGTQSRTRTDFHCNAAGACASSQHTENQTCGRSTTGTSCGTPAVEETCSYASDCATSGTLTRKTTAYTCSSGGCQPNTTTQNFPGGCTRSTEGQMCDGSWLNVCRSGSCSYCDGACGGSRSYCCEPGVCVTSEMHCY